MPDLTGTTLGKYRLLERLGRGGMAEVYRAFQPNLEREVAVKVMHGYLAEDADFVGRFKREAKAVAALRHPHIVQVYDFDVEGDVYYMVMEYIGGETLKARLERLHAAGRRLSLAETEAILRPLCEALDYAHSQGRVHRDIKPGNIMFDGQRLVLTDFGIATIVGGTCYTAPGTMVGTPAYMSPEQCRGEPGDARSDIYSLGIVLYEMITGRLPFDADTPLAIVMKHLNDPLPLPSRVIGDLPSAVEQVILKALAKSPEDRYPSALALADAFSAAVRGEVAVAAATAGAPPAVEVGRQAVSPLPPAAAVPAKAGEAAAAPARARRTPLGGRRRPAWAWGGLAVMLVLVTVSVLILTGALRRPGAMPTAPTPFATATLPPVGSPLPTVAVTPLYSDAQTAYEAGLRALNEQGDSRQAIADFTAAIEADPRMAEAYFWRAVAYKMDGQPAAGVADLTQAIALRPEWPEAYYERADMALRLDPPQAESARADLSRAIELRPDYASAYTQRAQVSYWYMGDADAALEDLDRALALDPHQTEAWQTRGEIYFDRGDYEQAIADLYQAVTRNPDDVYSQRLLALAYYFHGEYDEAVQHYGQALEYEPDVETYYGRGMARAAAGDEAGAMEDLAQALLLDPGHSGARYGRGRLYAGAGRFEEAIADFTAAIEDGAERWYWPFFMNDSPWIDRALAYQSLGRFEDALADLNTAVERFGDWHLPYYYRGLLYKEMGQREAAIADFQQVYDLAPDDEWRRRAAGEIAALSP